MAGRAVADDALGIERRALRRSPWRAGARLKILAVERPLLTLMFGVLTHAGAKRRLVGKLAGLAKKSVACPFVHRQAKP